MHFFLFTARIRAPSAPTQAAAPLATPSRIHATITTDSTVSARALASRRNGARSRGPKTAEGRARSARNALKHGLRAQTVLLGDEDPARFARFAAGLRAELAPATPLQAELVLRITVAAWRADRLEAALLDRHLGPNPLERADAQEALGAGLVRDGHGPRAHEPR